MVKKIFNSVEDFMDNTLVDVEWHDGTHFEALLVKEGSKWYLLQNHHDGCAPSNMRGYNFGWSLGSSWTKGGDDVDGLSIKGTFRFKSAAIEKAEKTWEDFMGALDSVKARAMEFDDVDFVKKMTTALKRLAK